MDTVLNCLFPPMILMNIVLGILLIAAPERIEKLLPATKLDPTRRAVVHLLLAAAFWITFAT